MSSVLTYRTESELASELAALVRPLLAHHERTRLYVTLGSGESYAAIVVLLQILATRRLRLRGELVASLRHWLETYAQSDDAPPLRHLLDTIGTTS